MWRLSQRFAMGSLLGGVAVSLCTLFILHDHTYALWQLCWGYATTACLSGLLFGGTARLLGQPRGDLSRKNLRFTWIAGAMAPVLQFTGTTLTRNLETEQTLLFVLPPLAAILLVWKLRRQGSRSDCPAVMQDEI